MKNSGQGGGFGARITTFSNNKILRKILRAIYPPAPFINIILSRERKLIKSAVFPNGARVLDVGAGLAKGPGSWLWDPLYLAKVEIVRLDICDGQNIDIVADATNLPKDIGLFDSVILQSVPEHVENISMLFQQVTSVLKNGGVLYIEMPFLQGVHGDPSDFWRATIPGLAHLVSPCKIIMAGVSGGPFGSLIWIISDLLSNISQSKGLNSLVRFVLRWILAPFRVFDILLLNTEAAKRLACEYYCLVKK
jgi:hypothetical protein